MFALILASIIGVSSPLPAASGCAAATAFTGTICTPKAAGKHPAILLLGGSEGGDMMRLAAPQFADAGYVAASVAYFGAPGLPSQLAEIPVETVGKALDDIAKRPDVDPTRIALFGVSKGGELALLAASTYPQFKAVVADVPSPFAWAGIPQGPGPVGSSWTLGGKPVPFVPHFSLPKKIFFLDIQLVVPSRTGTKIGSSQYKIRRSSAKHSSFPPLKGMK